MDDYGVKLRKALEKEKKWPLKYMFKFIVPNDMVKLESVKMLLPDPSKVVVKSSKTMKYLSISGVYFMKSPESIISIYEEAGKLEGVMAL